ncbi:hypothetical protein LSAT2_032285 [Lamellibrachia satsuma]|nr:hypothetical protein LSAT2_032285 [Lamellibrachia satsuma]
MAAITASSVMDAIVETKEVPNAEVGANMFPNIEDDVVVTDAKVNVVVSDVAYDDGLRCCYVNSDDGLRCKNTGSEDTSDQQSTASYKKCRIGGKRLKETPLPFCVLIVSHSKVAFGLTLTCHMLALFVTGVLVAVRYDIFPVAFGQLPLTIRDSDDYLRGLAWMHRHQETSLIRRGRTNSTVQLKRSVPIEALQLFFELAGGNVLTKAALTEMRRVEDKFYTNAIYQKSFCMMSTNQSNCVKPMSILRFFDGTYATLDPVFYDPDFANISGVISTADQHPETRRSLRHCLGTGAVINADVAVVNITRTNLFLGLPLSGYTNDSDRATEQKTKVKVFIVKTLMSIGNEYYATGVGDMTFFYGNSVTVQASIRQAVFRDLRLVGGGYVFVFGYMWWQTNSFCLTSLVLLTTTTGFCGANLIYRIVLGYRYFGIFHVLSIFIMLCISADGVFVFHDTWRLAAFEQHVSLAHRLSTCYRHVAPTILFTSLTTTVAFSVSAASPLLSVSTFGLFSAFLVVINYLSAVTFLPCAIVYLHIHWPHCACSQQQQQDTARRGQASTQNINMMVNFFRGPYFRLITHHWARWVIVAMFTIIIATATYSATLLQINDGSLKMIPDQTNTGRFLSASLSAFEGRNVRDTISVYMVWGMKNQDLIDCDQSDVDCTGKTVWNTNFDLNSEDVQIALLHFCNRLKRLTDNEVNELYIRRDISTHTPEVSCFVDAMNTFFRNEGNRSTNTGRFYPPGIKFDLPLSKIEAQRIMNCHPSVYKPIDVTRLYSGYFEVMMSFWLHNGFRCGPPSNDFRQFNRLLGEQVILGYKRSVTVLCPGGAIEYAYGTKLRFAAIVVNLTLSKIRFAYPMGLLIRDKWERFFDEESLVYLELPHLLRMADRMKKMPPALHKGFLVAVGETYSSRKFNLWHFYLVQQSITRFALLGCVIGLALALPIIVIATHNVYVGLLATLTLVFVTVSVVAVIPLAGWKLGILESMNLILVVGLAVDYVVHLAQSYAHSPYHGRLERTRHALEQVGFSMMSGACTTLGASAFLLFCDFVYFRQFGLILFATIGFSFIYAIGLFMTVLGMIGHERRADSTYVSHTIGEIRTSRHNGNVLHSTSSSLAPLDIPTDLSYKSSHSSLYINHVRNMLSIFGEMETTDEEPSSTGHMETTVYSRKVSPSVRVTLQTPGSVMSILNRIELMERLAMEIDLTQGHTLLRADRSSELSGKERGGGICFLVNHRWCNDSTIMSSSCSPELESLTVNCKPFYSPREFSSVILMGVYIPPDANATSAINQLTTRVLTTRVLAAETTYPDSVIIILGDFNHTNLKKVLPRYKQHVNCSTRNNKTLDHCYTIFKDAYRATTRAPFGESDHATVVLIPTYRQKLKTIKPTTKTVRKRTADSTIALKACLDSTDWQMFKDSCHDLDSYTDTVTAYISWCEETCYETIYNADPSFPDQLNDFYSRFDKLNTSPEQRPLPTDTPLSPPFTDLFIYLAVCATPSALYKTNIIQPTISLNSFPPPQATLPQSSSAQKLHVEQTDPLTVGDEPLSGYRLFDILPLVEFVQQFPCPTCQHSGYDATELGAGLATTCNTHKTTWRLTKFASFPFCGARNTTFLRNVTDIVTQRAAAVKKRSRTMAMSTVELPSTNDAVVETDTITKDSTVVQKGKDSTVVQKGKDSTVVQKGKDSTVVQKGKDNADVSNGEKYSAAVPDSTDSVDIPFDMVKKDGMRFVESKETFITQSSTLHTEKSNCSTVETDLRKPLGFCNWIVSHYKAAFGLTLSCHMVALFVTGVLIARGLFPISREELHLTIRENDDYLRGLAWMHRHEDKSIIRQGRTNEAVQLERSMSVEPLQLFFELAGGNVLTKAALTDMRRVEDKFYTNAVYQKSFCWLVQSGCVKPMSILRYFDGTYATLDPVFYDPDFANISGVISTADQHPETRRSLRHCLGTGAVINVAAAVANITRAMLYLGLPLSGYHNDSDRVSEQKAKVKTFFKNALMPLGNEYFAAGVGDMTFFYGSSVTVVLGIRQTSLRDLWLVAGAYVFIFVYLWWQTSSLWLASFVMLTTASGYCGSYLVYRVVFGYSYFGVLHELTIFIMLAMNADDVFVFHNAWRLAEAHASLVRRLSTSYRQAAPAMFFASLTKIVAFSVGAASPLFSVSTFGLFSAILVVINYLTAITFVPCALVLYHIHLRRCVCCCCCPQEGDAPTRCMQSTHFVVRFFRGPYFRLITHPCARWVILAAFAVIIAAATYTMALMRMNDGPVKMIPDHTNTGRYLLARRTAFEGRSVHDTIAVYMVWGMKKMDMTNCHPSNINCIGPTKWDTSFSLESEDVQLALLHFCKRLKSLSENDITQLYIRRDKTTNEPEVTCFIDEMDKFFMKEGNRKSNTGDRVYPQNASFGIPLEDHDAHVIMASHSNVYRPEDTSGLLTGYFEGYN